MTFHDPRLDVSASDSVDVPASRPSRGGRRPSFQWATVAMLALAALVTLGLHFALERGDQGADRSRLAAAIGID